MLEVILGSKTKVKILEILSEYPDGLTRNKIAEYSSLHPNNIYDQIDDLLFLDIIATNGKIYFLNSNHLLYETLRSFFQLFTEYTHHFSNNIIPFISSKLTTNYYFTGYFAATRMITPIDYSENLINIVIVSPHYSYFDKKLALLTTLENISYQKLEPGKVSIFAHEGKDIPADVKLEKYNGQDIFLSSITRGIIDCFRYPGTSDYGKCLILIQNEQEGLLDYSILTEEYKNNTIPIDLQFIIQKLVDIAFGSFQQMKNVTQKSIQIAEEKRNSLHKTLIEAISTVEGAY